MFSRARGCCAAEDRKEQARDSGPEPSGRKRPLQERRRPLVSMVPLVPGAGGPGRGPAYFGHPPVQAKLDVSAPGDRDEREADEVADQVMRLKAPGVRGGASGAIHRLCDACAEEAEEEAAAESKLEAVRGGRELTPRERYFFEPRFGSDFSRVRIHTGPAADAAARAVGALAYTRGSDIVFRDGSYAAPDSPRSRRLLAHELTHVVQQGAGGRAPGRSVHRQEAPTPLAGEPRRSSTCSGERSLPVSESFSYVRGVTYSLPFHAPAGRTVTIDVAAEHDASASGAPATFGVDLYQCCVVSDSRLTPTQTIGTIGSPGHPTHLRLSIALTDECSWSSRHGTDFIYYLRIYNANQTGLVRISYTVS